MVQGNPSGNLLMGNGTTVVSQAMSGDVTQRGAGTTTIGAQKLGISKMTVSASPRLFSRTTAGAGAGEKLSVDASLNLSAGALQRAALTGDVTSAAGSNATAIAATWASFTPAITGTGWALGNATVACAYVQVAKIVFAHYDITWGASSTFGTGGLGSSFR